MKRQLISWSHLEARPAPPARRSRRARSLPHCGRVGALLTVLGLGPVAGVADDPYLVLDLVPGRDSSNIGELVAVAGGAFFERWDGPTQSWQIWHSDATGDGTGLVADFPPATYCLGPYLLTAVGEEIWFFVFRRQEAVEADPDGECRAELWRSDPLAATRLVELPPGSSPSHQVGTEDRLFFTLQEDATGEEPWVSDGTPDGTHLVEDLVPGPGGSLPHCPYRFGEEILYGALLNPDAVVRSDGVSATVLASGPDFCLGAFWQGHVYFFGYSTELWRTDGTPAGTSAVRTRFVFADDVHAADDGVYFHADDGVHGWELWTSDGTEGGTRLIADIDPRSNQFRRGVARVTGGVIFHGPQDELWFTDGTEAGTGLVHEVPGDQSFNPGLSEVGHAGTSYFLANPPDTGEDLWKSDGTPLGTVPLGEILPGPGLIDASPLVQAGTLVFLLANDGVHGRELWALDLLPLFADGFESGDTSAWTTTVR